MMSTDLASTPNGQKAIAAGAVIQQVATQYTTAVSVQHPRSLAVACRMLEEEANLSGELFYYGWGKGTDAIEGPSVKLALAAVRCFGNCAVDMGEVQDTPDAWIFTARFVDLQTGYTLSRQFRQSKLWVVYGKHDAARKDDIRFQIGQSKAIRNVVLNAIPAFIIDKAMEAAKAGTRDKLIRFINEQDRKAPGTGLPNAVKMVVSGLLKHGVTEKMVLDKFEVANTAALDIDRLIILRGDLNAIERGEILAEEAYPASKQSTVEDLKKKIEDQKRAGEEAKRKAEEEAKRKAEEEAKRKAEEEAKRKAEEAAKPPLAEGEIPNEPPAEVPKGGKGKGKNKPKQERESGIDDDTEEDLTAGL